MTKGVAMSLAVPRTSKGTSGEKIEEITGRIRNKARKNSLKFLHTCEVPDSVAQTSRAVS